MDDAEETPQQPTGAGTIGSQYAYFRLGTEQGGNIHLWRSAVGMEAKRVREALAELRPPRPSRDASERLDADAHFLLVAVRNGLRFAERVQEKVEDEQLGEALAGFAKRFSDAHDLRDVFTHMDEYVLDQGRLQPAGQSRRKGEVGAGTPSWWQVVGDDVALHFGPFTVRLLEVAGEAERVLGIAADAWQAGLTAGVDGLGAGDD